MKTNTEQSSSEINLSNNVVKLIDGIFHADEAGKVLFSLINSKINYHTLETLSSKEIYGVENENSIKRIEELRLANAAIAKILSEVKESGKKLKIDAVINISIE